MSIQKHFFLRLAWLAGVLMLLNTPIVQGATPACGTTLTKNTTLDSDMNCPSRALRFSGKNSNKVTLDCAGFSISTDSDRVIAADSVSKITIKNCTLITTHNDGRGIVLTGVTKSKISGNTITTMGEESRAIGLRGKSSSNSITNNTIHTEGSDSEGILIRSGSDKNAVKNNTFQADASHAVSIRSASNNTLSGNTLISPDGYLFQGKFRLQNGGMSVDAAGNIYAVENNWGSSARGSAGIGKATAFFMLDPATGAAFSVIPLRAGKKNINFGFDALEVLPNGGVLALAGSGAPSLLYEIDPNTGKVNDIALNLAAEVTGKLNGLDAINNTTLLATTNQGELLNIDLNSGDVTEIGDQNTGLTDLALHPTNGKAYAVSRRRDEASNTAHLYEIDVNTGAITEIGDTGALLISDIDFALDGKLYGSLNLEVIDITTGLSTTVGSFGPDPLEPQPKKNRLKGNLFQTADGSVQFTGNITLPSAEIDISSALVEIMANQVLVDSAVLPFLDEKARISLNNITGTYQNLLVDPEDDGSFVPCASRKCKFVSFQNGTLVFDVNGFTTYSSEENTDPTLEFVVAWVLAEIKTLQNDPGISKAAKKKLKAAEKDIAKALKFLKKGDIKKGLPELSKAVTDLLKAQDKGAPVGGPIDQLVASAQNEAQTAIDEAIAGNSDAALIAEAEANMTAAQDLLNQGKPDKAINAYKNAWVKARKATNSGGGSNNGGGTNTGLQLYQMLDDALAQKVVSTTDPSGLWIFYGKGGANFQSNLAGSSLLRDETINLFAFVVSVYVTDNMGTPQIALNSCTAGYNGNSLLESLTIPGPNSFNQFTMDLQKMRQMAGTLYPFNPGDALGDANYQAFLNTDFTVTLINNREMIFPADFTFTDGTGGIQGSFTANFKARKISDNFNDTLGDFVVNSVNRDSHCFEYLNQFNGEASSTTFQGQTTSIESDFMWEKFAIRSWPDSLDGISSFLYQDRGAFTPVFNGQPTTLSDPLTSVSMLNTASMFPNVNASNFLGTVNLNYNFSTNTGVMMDYSISSGVNTLTGKVEALY